MHHRIHPKYHNMSPKNRISLLWESRKYLSMTLNNNNFHNGKHHNERKILLLLSIAKTLREKNTSRDQFSTNSISLKLSQIH